MILEQKALYIWCDPQENRKISPYLEASEDLPLIFILVVSQPGVSVIDYFNHLPLPCGMCHRYKD